MKVLLITLLTIVGTLIVHAQQDSLRNDSTIRLQEVEVKTARIMNRIDGMMYIPSDQQKSSASNGYDLLSLLSLPKIRVDEVNHSVSAIDNKGNVQIRINGAVANKSDLMALSPINIKSVEFIDNPSVRYGEGIGYVINIKSKRADSGYTLGASLTNSVTSWQGDNIVYAKWNHKNSELGFTYDFGYNDIRHFLTNETSDYQLNDGSHYYIWRTDSARRIRSFTNDIKLKYVLADSASYVFQATLSGSFSHNPGSNKFSRFTSQGNDEGIQSALITDYGQDKSFSPVIDLYFFHTLGKNQSITANLVGTSISTNRYNFNNEGSEYAYYVDGKTWSLTSEVVYENKLKPFTLSVGVNNQVKYTRNIYSGDAMSTNNMHSSTTYLFGMIKGCLSLFPQRKESGNNINYSIGLGASNAQFRQGNASYNRWLFRPKLSLTYLISKSWSLSYDLEVSQHISQIAMISNTRIRTNSMEWTVGNPNIKPNSVFKNTLKLAYSKPRFYYELYGEWRNNHNCNMASYERTVDNQFLYMQKNQPHVNMFIIDNYLSYDIIPDKLKASVDGGMYRYFNRGDNYNHCLTSWLYSIGLQAFLGKWTLTGFADSGYKFMEGEIWNHQGGTTQLRCSYRFGNCHLSLIIQHPFEAHPKFVHQGLVNQFMHKDIVARSNDDGNAVSISISWRFNSGRKYKTVERRMENKDTQTGIIVPKL